MADEQEQEQPDLAGYSSVNELAKGYRESGSEAKKQRERAERAEALALSLQSQANPRQEVPRRDSAGQRLSEYGIPVDALDEYIEQKAEAKFAQRFEPLMKGIQSRGEMVGRYKDYAPNESAIMEVVNSDPNAARTYANIFQADPSAAVEFAYLKWKVANPPKSGRNPEEQSEAQIPTNRSGDTRRAPQGNDARIQELRNAYAQTPNRRTAEALAKERLHTIITDEFLNQ